MDWFSSLYSNARLHATAGCVDQYIDLTILLRHLNEAFGYSSVPESNSSVTACCRKAIFVPKEYPKMCT